MAGDILTQRLRSTEKMFYDANVYMNLSTKPALAQRTKDRVPMMNCSMELVN